MVRSGQVRSGHGNLEEHRKICIEKVSEFDTKFSHKITVVWVVVGCDRGVAGFTGLTERDSKLNKEW